MKQSIIAIKYCCCIFFTILSFTSSLSAQVDQSVSDSLSTALQLAKADSTRLKIQLALLENTDQNQRTEALKLVEEILATAQKMLATDTLAFIRTQYQIGLQYERKRMYKAAIPHFQKAIELESQDNFRWLDLAHYHLARSYMRLAQLDKAMAQLEIMAQLATETNNPKRLALAKEYMGIIYRNRGETGKSLAYLKAAIDLVAPLDDPTALMGLYNSLGRTYRVKTNYDSARILYTESLKIAKRIDNEKSVARVYNNLGNIFQETGQLDSALANYLNSMEIKEKLGDQRSLSIAYHNIGSIRKNLKSYELALQDLDKSLALASATEYKVLIVYNLHKIANIKRELGNPEEAIQQHQEALQLAKEIQLKKGVFEGTINLGDDYLALKDYRNSLKYFLESLSLAEAMESKLHTSYALIGIAESYMLYHQEGKAKKEFANFTTRTPQEIEKLLFQALAIAQETRNLENILTALTALQAFYKNNDNTTQEVIYARQYIQYKDSLFNQQKAAALADWETQYETREKEKAITLLEKENELGKREKELLTTQNRYYIALATTLLFCLLTGIYLLLRLRKSKNKIESQHTQLQQLNHTKDKFFGIIAHDIRSPILALDGVKEQMEYYLKKGQQDKLARLANRVDTTAKSLTGLLDNLLKWALLQQGVIPYHPEILHVQTVLENTVAMFQNNAVAKDISLQIEVDATLQMFVDESAVYTILRNLLSNAIKFTPPGGSITFKGKAKATAIGIELIDTGTGIAPEMLAKLFLLERKSEQGTAGEKGTGLGLSLVKELVELNKGKIEVVSQLGNGTQFHLSLPNKRTVIS